MSKVESFLWRFSLAIICIRPFLSEYAFPTLGNWYIFLLILSCLALIAPLAREALLPLRLNLWPFAFLLTILLSMLFSGWTRWSSTELYFFIPNILIFYIASRIGLRQQKQLISAVFITATIICLYAIYQYFIGLRHTLEYLSPQQQSGSIGRFLRSRRVFATFISPNIFASYIIMMLFVAIGLLKSAVKGKEKIIYWTGIIAMGLSLLYTKCLGGILAFLIAFLLFAPFLFPFFGFKRISIPRFSIIVIFIACAFILICRLLFWERLLQFLDLPNPNNSIVQRLYYWKASIDMIKEYSLTGIGWRKFGALYEFYKPPLANTSHYSHNVFLQIPVETGLMGMASFLLIVATFLRNGLIVIRKGGAETPLKAGLFCAGCVFLIHNVIDLSFYFGQVAFFWWMVAGLFSNFRTENPVSP